MAKLHEHNVHGDQSSMISNVTDISEFANVTIWAKDPSLNAWHEKPDVLIGNSYS